MAREDLSKKVDLAFLAPFYGAPLTESRRRVLSRHCEEDLSLGELAEELGVSRQSVHESLSRASGRLYELEAALGMAERFRRMEAGLDAALASLRKKDYPGAERVLQDLLTLDQEEKNGL